MNILDLDENYTIFLTLTDNNDMHKASIKSIMSKIRLFTTEIHFLAKFEP